MASRTLLRFQWQLRRALPFRYLSFSLAAAMCAAHDQTALAGFCLVWALCVHQLGSMAAQRLAFHPELMATLHCLEAMLLIWLFVRARLDLLPVVCSVLALLAGAVAQGGVRWLWPVLLASVFAISMAAPSYLGAQWSNFSATSFWAVLLLGFLTLGLSYTGFGRVRQVHRSRLRQHALTQRLARYLPTTALARLQNVDAPVLAAPLTWQRCWLTIAFVDLVGFTRLSLQVSAEECALLLNDYLTTLESLTDQHQAHLCQFVGDGVLVVWGGYTLDLPTPNAQASARLAVALCQQVPLALQQREVFWRGQGCIAPLRARIGVASGYCTLGDWGSRRLDYGVIGPPVNLAHRLQQLAADAALLDDATAGLLGADFSLGPKRQVKIDGFGAVTVHCVI